MNSQTPHDSVAVIDDTDNTEAKRPALRLYGLDVLRGFAALSVVIFHWQFWGRQAAPEGGVSMPRIVSDTFLNFFYECGVSAVGLFFVLSGFIFYWLFKEPIGRNRIDARGFFIDRFSRLYPLFFATLVWAWGGHNLYAWMNQGPNWNPGANDLVGFLRQVFVFPLWTPTRVIGFNLPSWSLPVEALMYTLFFLLARRRLLGTVGTLAMVAAALGAGLYSNDIGYGMTCFFMGGVCYLLYEQAASVRLERPLRILLAVSWPVAIVLGSGVIDISKTRIAFLDHYYAMYVLFPATVLYLALLERRKGPVAKRLAWFGDATYSMYLLHFPMMLTTAIVFRAAGWNFALLTMPVALVIFVVVLVVLSVGSHRYFERPIQDWIRLRFVRARAAGASRTVAPSAG